jgi:hypothetical protein
MELPSNALTNPLLPSGVYRYAVDVQPRDAPTLLLAGGATTGWQRSTALAIAHPDLYKRRRDISDITVWGSVDPNYHPRIGTSLITSAAMAFTDIIPIVFSAGAGVKTINVRLRFLSGRYIDASVTYTLTLSTPHVTILRQPFREFLQSSDLITLAWSCSHALTAAYVCVTDDYQSLRPACGQILTGTNVNGPMSVAAGTMVESTFGYPAALAASASLVSPLNITGQTYIKVFASTAAGETS